MSALLRVFLLITCCAASPACASRERLRLPMPQTHHTIDYIEFSVLDMEQAKQFYASAFGWAFTDYGPDYAGIQRQGGGEVGGMERVDDVARGGPLVILYSENLEASLAAVQAAGGRIVAEIFPFPGGRRFQFTDPSGNELAVWSDA